MKVSIIVCIEKKRFGDKKSKQIRIKDHQESRLLEGDDMGCGLKYGLGKETEFKTFVGL